MSSRSSLLVKVRERRGALNLHCDIRFERWPAVIFGPSGAGKSSLLRIIAGLDPAPSSQVDFNGQTIGNIGVRAVGLVQMVAQRSSLFPHLNVAANVAFGLQHLSKYARRTRVEEVLQLVGAEDLATRMPAQLSGGESRRVAVARALAPRPRLLLLDEPFSGLGTAGRSDILQDLMKVFTQIGLSALFVTHDVTDALQLRAEVVMLTNGSVVAQGPAEEVLSTERERLAALLRSPSEHGV